MPPHWHNELEIVRVVRGNLVIYLNNKETRLGDNDVIFIEPKCLHRGEPQNDCIYECIVFDLHMLYHRKEGRAAGYIRPLVKGIKGIDCILSNTSPLRYSVERLFTLMRLGNNYFELEIYATLFEIFHKLYSNAHICDSSKTPHNKQSEIIASLLNFIEDNYAESITLKTLSQQSGLSEKYLCRLFKTYTLKTPIEYLNAFRIEQACLTFYNQEKNITEIAFECGFNDLSYFSKIFKAIKGITPREYKQTIKNP